MRRQTEPAPHPVNSVARELTPHFYAKLGRLGSSDRETFFELGGEKPDGLEELGAMPIDGLRAPIDGALRTPIDCS